MSKTNDRDRGIESAPAHADGGVAPGKVTATARIQRKAADGGAAASAPAGGPAFDEPAGGMSRADDPFGMHLSGGGEQAAGPPAQNASDRILVSVNGQAPETWMIVKIVDATSFVARDPGGGQHKFSKGAATREVPLMGGGVEQAPLITRRVYDVQMTPESLAARTKGAVGRVWHHVQQGFQWIEEQATGKTRAELDAEEAERNPPRAHAGPRG